MQRYKLFNFFLEYAHMIGMYLLHLRAPVLEVNSSKLTKHFFVVLNKKNLQWLRLRKPSFCESNGALLTPDEGITMSLIFLF